MPKRIIKRWLPDQDKLSASTSTCGCSGRLLLDANLWHLNRRSAAGACAVGLFMAWIPPRQMLLAAGGAIACRVNLPSLPWSWYGSSNPFTMPPMFCGAYLTGCQLLGATLPHIIEIPSSPGPGWVSVFETVAPPLLLGSWCSPC